MKASKKSLHARLYQFTFTTSLPENLCPYFWKLVWAVIVFIPNFIIQLPSLIVDKLYKDKWMDCADHRDNGLSIYRWMFFLFVYFGITWHWIKAMFHCYSYSYVAANLGLAVNAIIGIVLIFAISIEWQNRIEERKNKKREKKPSIIIEFIKAKYYKYCPKIDWE